jgi:hypothetical protein
MQLTHNETPSPAPIACRSPDHSLLLLGCCSKVQAPHKHTWKASAGQDQKPITKLLRKVSLFTSLTTKAVSDLDQHWYQTILSVYAWTCSKLIFFFFCRMHAQSGMQLVGMAASEQRDIVRRRSPHFYVEVVFQRLCLCELVLLP